MKNQNLWEGDVRVYISGQLSSLNVSSLSGWVYLRFIEYFLGSCSHFPSSLSPKEGPALMHCSSNPFPWSSLLLWVKTTQAMDCPSHRNSNTLEEKNKQTNKPARASKEKQSVHRYIAPASHSPANAGALAGGSMLKGELGMYWCCSCCQWWYYFKYGGTLQDACTRAACPAWSKCLEWGTDPLPGCVGHLKKKCSKQVYVANYLIKGRKSGSWNWGRCWMLCFLVHFYYWVMSCWG